MKWDSLATWGSAMAQGGGGAQPSTLEYLVMPVGMLVIMYFFMIMPQRRKQKQLQTMLNELKSGDEVLTNAGIIGRVKNVAEAFVTVEIAPNTPVKFSKSAIASLTKPHAVSAAPVKAK